MVNNAEYMYTCMYMYMYATMDLPQNKTKMDA